MLKSSRSEPNLLILPSGAIPMDFVQGHKNPEVERSLYTPSKDSSMIESLTDTVILLRKQLKRVTRERDIYKTYVPRELLSMGGLVRHTPSPSSDAARDVGQITDE